MIETLAGVVSGHLVVQARSLQTYYMGTKVLLVTPSSRKGHRCDFFLQGVSLIYN